MKVKQQCLELDLDVQHESSSGDTYMGGPHGEDDDNDDRTDFK